MQELFDQNNDVILKLKVDFLQLMDDLKQYNDDIFTGINTFKSDLDSILNQEDVCKQETDPSPQNGVNFTEVAKIAGKMFDVENKMTHFAWKIAGLGRDYQRTETEFRKKSVEKKEKLIESNAFLQRLKQLAASKNGNTSDSQLAQNKSSEENHEESQPLKTISDSELVKTIKEGSILDLFDLIASGAHLDFESIKTFPVGKDFIVNHQALEKFQLLQATGLDIVAFAKRTGLLSNVPGVDAVGMPVKGTIKDDRTSQKYQVKQFNKWALKNMSQPSNGDCDTAESQAQSTAAMPETSGLELALQIKNVSLPQWKHWIDSGISFDFDSIDTFSVDLDFCRNGYGLKKLKLFQENGLDIGEFATRTGLLKDVKTLSHQPRRKSGMQKSHRQDFTAFKAFIFNETGNNNRTNGGNAQISLTGTNEGNPAAKEYQALTGADLVEEIKNVSLPQWRHWVALGVHIDFDSIDKFTGNRFCQKEDGLNKLKLFKEYGLDIGDFATRTGLLDSVKKFSNYRISNKQKKQYAEVRDFIFKETGTPHAAEHQDNEIVKSGTNEGSSSAKQLKESSSLASEYQALSGTNLVEEIKKCPLKKCEAFLRTRSSDLQEINRFPINSMFIHNEHGLQKLTFIKNMNLFDMGDFVRRTGILADFISQFGGNCENIKTNKEISRQRIYAFHEFINECVMGTQSF